MNGPQQSWRYFGYKAEQSNIVRCEDLAGQAKEINETTLKVIPIRIGALVTISRIISTSHNPLGIPDIIECQKAAALDGKSCVSTLWIGAEI